MGLLCSFAVKKEHGVGPSSDKENPTPVSILFPVASGGQINVVFRRIAQLPPTWYYPLAILAAAAGHFDQPLSETDRSVINTLKQNWPSLMRKVRSTLVSLCPLLSGMLPTNAVDVFTDVG